MEDAASGRHVWGRIRMALSLDLIDMSGPHAREVGLLLLRIARQIPQADAANTEKPQINALTWGFA